MTINEVRLGEMYEVRLSNHIVCLGRVVVKSETGVKMQCEDIQDGSLTRRIITLDGLDLEHLRCPDQTRKERRRELVEIAARAFTVAGVGTKESVLHAFGVQDVLDQKMKDYL